MPRSTQIAGLILSIALSALAPGVAGAATTLSITPNAPLAPLGPEQAGGHPDVTVTVDFCASTTPCSDQRALKNLLIGLPPGLIANPQAVAKCNQVDLSTCPGNAQVGEIKIAAESNGAVLPEADGLVYNQQPKSGEVARFGVYVANFPNASQSVGFSLGPDGKIAQQAVDFPSQLNGQQLKVRSLEYKLFGIVGGKPFMYNPTSCGTRQGAVEASYYNGSSETALAGYTTTGCNNLPPLQPTAELVPETSKAGAPSGYTFRFDTGFDSTAAGADPLMSTIRNTRVEFPAGVSLSPGAAGQLDSCTTVQLASDSCPAASEIGSIEVSSPFVADNPVEGKAYFGVSTPSRRYPLLLKLEGEGVGVTIESQSILDPQTGQIVGLTIDQPQLPFESFEVKLRGGDRAVLANPEFCGNYAAKVTVTPWSGQPDETATTSTFTIDGDGNGGACANPRPFAPGFSAATSTTAARAQTHLNTSITRQDGEQALTGLKFQTPPGLTATLAQVPHCAASLAKSGDCPEASRVGDIAVDIGTGAAPLRQNGAMYLTEGINPGDVIGFSFVVRAKAGPVDLGKFVQVNGVRLSAGGDVATTEATNLPTIFEGVPIRLRKIEVNVNSDRFLLNPSGCSARQFSAEFSSAPEGGRASGSAPYQASGCDRLGFNPRLTFSAGAKGLTGFQAKPPVRAVVTQQPGEAAISNTRVAIPAILRPNLPAIQSQLCQAPTPRSCPPSKRVGTSRVDTPLLSEPISGNLYLVQKPGEILPRIMALYTGLVSVDVDSRNVIEGVAGNLRTVNYFDAVPDVPLDRVEFNFFGGKLGIISSFDDLCVADSFGDARFNSHNGKSVSYRTRLAVEGCPVQVRMTIKKRKLKI